LINDVPPPRVPPLYGGGVREVVVLVGLQASGKTTFYRQRFSGTHVHVSKDAFPGNRRPQRRQMVLIDEALAAGRDVVVDNTNPSPEDWAPIILAARSHGARVVAYWFPPDLGSSLARNAARDGRSRVPDVGLYATIKILREPSPADGFDEVHTVGFDGSGGFDVR
jgi:predicted kinase